jgi:hypothetical protein
VQIISQSVKKIHVQVQEVFLTAREVSDKVIPHLATHGVLLILLEKTNNFTGCEYGVHVL